MGGRDREDALSEIIGFVLILALIVVASTLYLMYVVPAEGREEEIEHMNQVKDRFVSYKTTLDAMWLRSLRPNQEDWPVTARGVTHSTSFDLGTGGGNTQSTGIFLSFMRPIGTAARMSINPSGDIIEIYVNTDSPETTTPLYRCDPGMLNYTSENYYWIQQTFSYEWGGVFLEQKQEGVSVKVAPGFSVYSPTNLTTNKTNYRVRVSNITLNGNAVLGGTGPLRIETRLREDMKYEEIHYHNLTIQVTARDDKWARAWHQVFLDATAGLDNSIITIPAPSSDHTVRLRIDPFSPGEPEARDVHLIKDDIPYSVRFQYADLG